MLIKQLLWFFLWVSIISIAIVIVWNYVAPISNSIVKNNITTIDRVLGNFKWYFVIRWSEWRNMIYKVVSMRLPNKIVVVKKVGEWANQRFLIKNIMYWSAKNGIAYMGLKNLKESKKDTNYLSLYQYPVWQLKIVRDLINKLDPQEYNIGWDAKKDLLNKLKSIEDFIARNQILAMTPFVQASSLSMKWLPNAMPVQIIIKKEKEGIFKNRWNNIWHVYFAFLGKKYNKRTKSFNYEYQWYFLDCIISTNGYNSYILKCQSRISKSYFKVWKKLITNFKWYFTYNDMYLYNFNN